MSSDPALFFPAAPAQVNDTPALVPASLRWCGDGCPRCYQSALPVALVHRTPTSVYLGYRCAAGHDWGCFWSPEAALAHARACEAEAARPRTTQTPDPSPTKGT